MTTAREPADCGVLPAGLGDRSCRVCPGGQKQTFVIIGAWPAAGQVSSDPGVTIPAAAARSDAPLLRAGPHDQVTPLGAIGRADPESVGQPLPVRGVQGISGPLAEMPAKLAGYLQDRELAGPTL